MCDAVWQVAAVDCRVAVGGITTVNCGQSLTRAMNARWLFAAAIPAWGCSIHMLRPCFMHCVVLSVALPLLFVFRFKLSLLVELCGNPLSLQLLYVCPTQSNTALALPAMLRLSHFSLITALPKPTLCLPCVQKFLLQFQTFWRAESGGRHLQRCACRPTNCVLRTRPNTSDLSTRHTVAASRSL